MDQSTSTTHGGLRGLLERLAALHAAGDAALLGIVVATEGSTYQKPGAIVLLARGGLRHGVISGGCLEPELEQRATAVFASGRALLTEFDTRSDEDLLFGSGTGCRGRMRLLLLPQPPGAPLAQALRACVERGKALRLALVLDPGEALGSGSAHLAGTGAATASWRWLATGAAPVAADTPRQGPADAIHALHIAPPPRLLLLGAGPETPPLLEFAARFGWSTTLVEHRGRWAAFARGSAADRRIETGPAAALAQLAPERFDAAVAMSHNFALDAQYLRFCARGAIGYVGLLGPPARRDALRAELGADADALGERLHAPVGLDLGGSGPEAIALAIAAQLQQFFARRRDA